MTFHSLKPLTLKPFQLHQGYLVNTTTVVTQERNCKIYNENVDIAGEDVLKLFD